MKKIVFVAIVLIGGLQVASVAAGDLSPKAAARVELFKRVKSESFRITLQNKPIETLFKALSAEVTNQAQIEFIKDEIRSRLMNMSAKELVTARDKSKRDSKEYEFYDKAYKVKLAIDTNKTLDSQDFAEFKAAYDDNQKRLEYEAEEDLDLLIPPAARGDFIAKEVLYNRLLRMSVDQLKKAVEAEWGKTILKSYLQRAIEIKTSADTVNAVNTKIKEAIEKGMGEDLLWYQMQKNILEPNKQVEIERANTLRGNVVALEEKLVDPNLTGEEVKVDVAGIEAQARDLNLNPGIRAKLREIFAERLGAGTTWRKRLRDVLGELRDVVGKAFKSFGEGVRKAGLDVVHSAGSMWGQKPAVRPETDDNDYGLGSRDVNGDGGGWRPTGDM